MNIALFYFSGTGNTWLVAKKIQEACQQLGTSCKLYSLESAIDIEKVFKEAEVIGLGYPIYGSNYPEPVRVFLDQLNKGPKRRFFVFCTQLRYSGDGAAIGAKALRNKGYPVRQLMHVNMPNNITDFRIVRWIKPKNEKALVRAVTRKAKRLTDAVIHDNRLKKGEGFGSRILGLIQRLPVQWLGSKAQNLIRVDDHCTACGLCVKLCPSHHLTLLDHQLVMGETCYLCYRCINHCPEKALHVAKRTRVKRPYLGPVSDFNIDDVRRHG